MPFSQFPIAPQMPSRDDQMSKIKALRQALASQPGGINLQPLARNEDEDRGDFRNRIIGRLSDVAGERGVSPFQPRLEGDGPQLPEGGIDFGNQGDILPGPVGGPSPQVLELLRNQATGLQGLFDNRQQSPEGTPPEGGNVPPQLIALIRSLMQRRGNL